MNPPFARLLANAAGIVSLALTLAAALHDRAAAASQPRPAPPGRFAEAPPEFTRFSPQELSRGFTALAFGSDLRLGSSVRRLHRFEQPVRVFVESGGSVQRHDSYRQILMEFAGAFPQLNLSIVGAREDANVTVRLIDEKDFAAAIEQVFGRKMARAFVAKTDPQCMTSVQSAERGGIVKVDSFVIVDQGDDVYFNCAYHEMLHVLGLSNHDQRNPWTALNQDRTVGYLTVYDRALVNILYDPRLKSGMTKTDVAKVLPDVAAHVAAGLDTAH